MGCLSLRDQVGQEIPHLRRDRSILLNRSGRLFVFREGVGDLQDRVAPALVPRPVCHGDAEHLRDHQHRQRDGKVRGQVHLAALDRPVQELTRQFPDAGL